MNQMLKLAEKDFKVFTTNMCEDVKNDYSMWKDKKPQQR